MNGFNHIVNLDIRQTLRSKWFWGYSILFGGFVALMFASGITESQIIGFLGLGRLMITFIQICISILPIFVLISTVRSVVGDRESNVLEYMLSMPISLGGYYWGKLAGRFITVFIPVFLALLGAVAWGTFSNITVPWDVFIFYSLLLASMIICFLGISIFISTLSRSQELAISMAFITWLILVAFLDLILLGVMLRFRVDAGVIISIAMFNPLQVFRTAAIALFDPNLTVLGPASYYILDRVSQPVFVGFSIAYPTLLGSLLAWLGFRSFKRSDLI
ncbi:MAG: ABC transporter permease [Candidatus Cloacimonetes bacterium 4572_55]|nr:MAG: ABC transporter permease [Candidatus Cloacimonetes bacterium 4572_55]